LVTGVKEKKDAKQTGVKQGFGVQQCDHMNTKRHKTGNLSIAVQWLAILFTVPGMRRRLVW
jgi:hypothetical protein